MHIITRRLITQINEIGYYPMLIYKLSTSIVITILAGIIYLCENEIDNGNIGVQLYYAPMIEYILMSFLIAWGGMFLLDITEKEIKNKAE